MGIREKMRRQFYIDICRCKGQIRRHCNGKDFRQKIISGSVSTMQQCIIKNINKNNH